MSLPIENLSSNKICAVITSYFPDEILVKLVAQVAPQTGLIIIVDNTVSSDSEKIFNLLEPNDKILIIKNLINVGLAKALNQGINNAKYLNYKWVITLDQDSEIAPNLIDVYRNFISSYPHLEKLGIIAANYKDKYSGHLGFHKKNETTDKWFEIPALITSGCFFSTSTFAEVGGFRENFLLDWVDHEFCLKVRKAGKHNYIYSAPLITHRLGFQTFHYILFKKFLASHHSAIRCYLIARNFITLAQEYYIREFYFIMYLLIVVAYKPISIILFEKNKPEKLIAFFKGISDGLCMETDTNFSDIIRAYSPKSTSALRKTE